MFKSIIMALVTLISVSTMAQADDYAYKGYAIEAQTQFRASFPQLQMNQGPIIIKGQQCEISVEINDVMDSPMRRPLVVKINQADRIVEFSPPVQRPFLGGLGQPKLDRDGVFILSAAQVLGGGYDGGGWVKHSYLKLSAHELTLITPNLSPNDFNESVMTCSF